MVKNTSTVQRHVYSKVTKHFFYGTGGPALLFILEKIMVKNTSALARQVYSKVTKHFLDGTGGPSPYCSS